MKKVTPKSITCGALLMSMLFVAHQNAVYAAAPLRGDFNADNVVNLADFNLFLPALHTNNAKYALTGNDNNYIDLFDYNEFLKTLGTSNAPAFGNKSTQLACDLTRDQPNVGKMLNVGTWNIGRLKGNDDLSDIKATMVGQKFKEYKLDIMIVQEVHIMRTRTGSDPITNTNLPAIVQSIVPEKLYFYSVYQEEVKHSVVIISKFPITDTGNGDINGGRKLAYGKVNSPVGPLWVFDAHIPNKGEDCGQCKAMSKATDIVVKITKPGDNFIMGGDFNMDYDEGEYYCPGPGTYSDRRQYCTADQSAQRLFDVSCTTTPCHYSRALTPHKDGVADFIIGGKGERKLMYQYCYLTNWGLDDAHPMFVGTVELR